MVKPKGLQFVSAVVIVPEAEEVVVIIILPRGSLQYCSFGVWD